ncbi:dehydratase [Helicobacter enhydrae]|uniref:Dehydratase n=1 Tax=Helicobacter enhydrae TaxID=222136 RepID=A0A1B1U3G4_9HELI|nr:MaoC/PaaZ C-terminal domain-containing protein [Helicobacter enhydrae]ANV97313.1 dehydratase [Helicobacter enhydrae]
MNAYAFDEIHIGHTESFEICITKEKMDSFLRITGDINPMHLDSQYAKKSGFESRIVYGMLSASFLSTFAGVYLPGKFCLLHEVALKFSNPVYVGDTLKITGRVSEKQEAYQQITIKMIIERIQREGGGGGIYV